MLSPTFIPTLRDRKNSTRGKRVKWRILSFENHWQGQHVYLLVHVEEESETYLHTNRHPFLDFEHFLEQHIFCRRIYELCKAIILGALTAQNDLLLVTVETSDDKKGYVISSHCPTFTQHVSKCHYSLS